MNLKKVILFLTIWIIFCSCKNYLGDKKVVLPYSIGEAVISENVDDQMLSIDLDGNFFYFQEEEFKRIWFSTNGFVELTDTTPLALTFRCTISNISQPLYENKFLIAPCCDDLKTKVSSAGERIYYRSSSSEKYDIYNDEDFSYVTEFLNNEYFSHLLDEGNEDFRVNIDWFFVLTFDRVSLIHTEHPQSFQLILSTDSTLNMSFVIVQYPSDGLAGHPNVIGLLTPSEKILMNDYLSPTNEEESYPYNINIGSNIGVGGTYAFRVDSFNSFYERKTCNNEYDFISCNRGNNLGRCKTFTNSTTKIKDYKCECFVSSKYSQIDGFDCSEISYSCFGVEYNDYENVCSGNGICKAFNQCDCFDGNFGYNCNITSCYNISNIPIINNNSLTTNNIQNNNNNITYLENNITNSFTNNISLSNNETIVGNISIIKNITENDTLLCSGNGNCVSYDNCVCYDYIDNIGGEKCDQPSCFGKLKILERNQSYQIFIHDKFDEISEQEWIKNGESKYENWTGCSFIPYLETEEENNELYGVSSKKGCGGDSGGYLYFYGNTSRSITTKKLMSGDLEVRFWFSHGRRSYHSLLNHEEVMNDIQYPNCQYELKKSFFQRDVKLRLLDANFEENVLYEETLGKNLGYPFYYENTIYSISQPFRFQLYQEKPDLSEVIEKGEGRIGEWGLDGLSLRILSSPNIPCSSKGSCLESGDCDCFSSLSQGKECEVPTCGGIRFDSVLVCSGHGDCISNENCVCTDKNYNGDYCEHKTSCFGIAGDSSLVCGGMGKCHSTSFNDFDTEDSSDNNNNNNNNNGDNENVDSNNLFYNSDRNFCCCNYGFFGIECKSSDDSDYLELRCFFGEDEDYISNDNNLIFWSSITGAHFMSSSYLISQKCPNILRSNNNNNNEDDDNGKYLYFYGTAKRELISNWNFEGGYKLLSFDLVRCSEQLSEYSDTLEVVIEEETRKIIPRTNSYSSNVNTRVIKEMELTEFSEIKNVEVFFATNCTFRLSLRQRYFLSSGDQWAVTNLTLIQAFPVQTSEDLGDWWILILLAIFTFAFMVFATVICLVLTYAFFHRMKVYVRGYFQKRYETMMNEEEFFRELLNVEDMEGEVEKEEGEESDMKNIMFSTMQSHPSVSKLSRSNTKEENDHWSLPSNSRPESAAVSDAGSSVYDMEPTPRDYYRNKQQQNFQSSNNKEEEEKAVNNSVEVKENVEEETLKKQEPNEEVMEKKNEEEEKESLEKEEEEEESIEIVVQDSIVDGKK